MEKLLLARILLILSSGTDGPFLSLSLAFTEFLAKVGSYVGFLSWLKKRSPKDFAPSLDFF